MALEQFDWQTASRTHTGNKRKVNEDSVLARPEHGLWAVADGMGGHAAGDVASQMLVERLESAPLSYASLSQFVDGAEELILDVHENIRQHSQETLGGKIMGCTVVTLLVKGHVGVCLWAGDSRLYRLRNGQLEVISSDHSQVNEMVEKGLLKPEEAKQHPRSNVITRAVGALPKLYLDVTLVEIKAGDLYMLCSDGLYGELEDDELMACLCDKASVEESVDGLVSSVLGKKAKDNLSVVLVRAPDTGASN